MTRGNTVLDPLNGTINGVSLPPVLAARLIRSKDVSGVPGPLPEADIRDVAGDFADDGIVYKIVSQSGRDELGEGSAYPNWAVAYKFEDVPEITTVTGNHVASQQGQDYPGCRTGPRRD